MKGYNGPIIKNRYGPIYFVYFKTTCLHPDAQFRFLEPFSVLHNIEKDGTFLAREPPKLGSRFQIYHGPPGGDVLTFLHKNDFVLKQTKTGALKLNNDYCPSPTKPKDPPSEPKNGNTVYQTKDCNREEQKFIFGKLT